MSTTHVLKTWPAYFDAVARGDKTFEVRRDDRGFQKGDRVRLREYRPPGSGPLAMTFTEREVTKRISYVLTGGQFGVEAGYVVLGLADDQVPGEVLS